MLCSNDFIHTLLKLTWIVKATFKPVIEGFAWSFSNIALLISHQQHGIRNPESENGITQERKWKQNTESNINDRKLKNFVLVSLAVLLNIFLLLCLGSLPGGYCTARPMKVILRLISY